MESVLVVKLGLEAEVSLPEKAALLALLSLLVAVEVHGFVPVLSGGAVPAVVSFLSVVCHSCELVSVGLTPGCSRRFHGPGVCSEECFPAVCFGDAVGVLLAPVCSALVPGLWPVLQELQGQLAREV